MPIPAIVYSLLRHILTKPAKSLLKKGMNPKTGIKWGKRKKTEFPDDPMYTKNLYVTKKIKQQAKDTLIPTKNLFTGKTTYKGLSPWVRGEKLDKTISYKPGYLLHKARRLARIKGLDKLKLPKGQKK